MIVITLTATPASLRGDLTKWLMEVSTGVYVGNISARVRDELWERVCFYCKEGQATMVFSAKNEQRLNFRVHNTSWILTDFDGLKLMKRPKALKDTEVPPFKEGYSNAAQRHQARNMAAKKQLSSTANKFPCDFIVLDLETTGVSNLVDKIIEIGAIKVANWEVVSEFSTLISVNSKIPANIIELTGIDDSMVIESGIPLKEALQGLIEFIGDYTIIAHNASFDFNFLQKSLQENELPTFKNKYIDTLTIAKHYIRNAVNYQLQTLLDMLSLDIKVTHRSLNDCRAVNRLYNQLIKNFVFQDE